MILFPERRIVIVTPPKTASDALHRVFCAPPWDGIMLVGRSKTGALDKHLSDLPAEALGFRVIATVRDPYDRLVSLYHQFMRHEAYWGRSGLAFWDFANRVGRPTEPIPWCDCAPSALYKLNQCEWLGELACEIVHVERLVVELATAGLEVGQVPRFNESWRRPVADYFDSSTLEVVREWCGRDCERFGYARLSDPQHPS